MYIPNARERVEIPGRSGLFLVVAVDQEAQRADLIALTDNAYVVEDVSCADLRQYQDTAEHETR
jgi:hypothetical protein